MRSTSTPTNAWTAERASRSARSRPIYYEDDLPEDLQPYQPDNAAFFFETLPGRNEPLGSPGGAAKMGPLGVDAPLVASLPEQDSQGGA